VQLGQFHNRSAISTAGIYTPGMDEPFGFAVQRIDAEFGPEQEPTEYGTMRYVKHPLDPPHWAISLPHQCERWDIAGGYGEGLPQAEALAELERFMAEAQQALAALREGQEFGDPDA
jgi:hypothetical protein